MDSTERRKTMTRRIFKVRMMMYFFRAAAVAGSDVK
jgi:hypothetical protein